MYSEGSCSVQSKYVLSTLGAAVGCKTSVEGADRCDCETTHYNHNYLIRATGKIVQRLEESKCQCYFQKRKENPENYSL